MVKLNVIIFLDYNGMVYNAYENIKKDIEENNYSKSKIEDLVLEELIKMTQDLICSVIRPKKLTYIALDGPAPRAKMVQQRSRRYKAILEKDFMKELKDKFKINESKESWDRSANISPGTEFMEKLSNRIVKAMKRRLFKNIIVK